MTLSTPVPTESVPTPRATATMPALPKPGPCTRGTAVTVGLVEPALGHRAVVIRVRNCSRKPIAISGYPVVRLLDARKRVVRVTVNHSSSYMAIDPGPRRHVVKPGRELLSVISWSGTVTDPDPAELVGGKYLSIAVEPSRPAHRFPVDADLGTTKELDLTAWAPDIVN